MNPVTAAAPPTVAILGATGAVGQELLELLAERSFPLKELRLLASPRSAGQTVSFKGETLTVQPVSAETLAGVDLVLASAGGSVSRQWAPLAVEQGAVVIDNSSAFRMDPQVPLVVPEVNPEAAKAHQGIIANPNCTTILLTLALAPLASLRPLRRVVVSTYQSASGAGARAMEELRQLVLQAKEQQIPTLGVCFGHQLIGHTFGGSVRQAPLPEVGWMALNQHHPDPRDAGPGNYAAAAGCGEHAGHRYL